MPNRHLATSTFASLAAFAFVACSAQSPVAPADVQYVTTLAQPAEGTTYLLTAYATSLGRGVVLDWSRVASSKKS